MIGTHKTKTLAVVCSFITLTFSNCGNHGDHEGHSEQKEEPIKAPEQTCTFSYNEESTLIKWTAYKHAAKAEVGGEFQSCWLEGFNTSESLTEALTGARLSIPVSSSNSNDSLRDWKIANKFFAVLTNTDTLVGTISEMVGDNKKGFASVDVQINDTTQSVNFEYEMNDNSELKFQGIINLPLWNAQPALDSLNKVCAEKHTGAPGEESILWPDVQVKIFTTLQKDCK